MESPNKSDNQKLKQFFDEIDNEITLSDDEYLFVRTPEFLDDMVMACLKEVISGFEKATPFQVAYQAAQAEIKIRKMLLTKYTTLSHLVLKQYKTDEERFYVRDDSECTGSGDDGGSQQMD